MQKDCLFVWNADTIEELIIEFLASFERIFYVISSKSGFKCSLGNFTAIVGST